MSLDASLFFLCVVCIEGIYTAFFVDELPITKVHPGENASIQWALVEPMSLEPVTRLAITGALQCESLQPVQCDTNNLKYDLTAIPPEANSNSSIQATAIVFLLENADIDDARNYEIKLTHGNQDSWATAVLYVFQEPATPVVTLSSSSSPEENTTIICSADSRSLPEESRHMVAMEYKWSVDVLRSDVGQNDDPLRTARATVSCTAQEEGSKFVSEAGVLNYNAETSAVNSPAIVLGVVLLLFVVTVCSLFGYMWYSGMLHEMKIPVNRPSHDLSDAASSRDSAAAAGNARDRGAATSGQYDQLGPRHTPQGYEETYEPIDASSGGRHFAESPLYENV